MGGAFQGVEDPCLPLFSCIVIVTDTSDHATRAPASGFDRIAWCYDALAGLVFGAALRRAQKAALEQLPTGAPRVLILGGGTGWVLTELLRRRPAASVLYLEESAAMLRRSQARLFFHLPDNQMQVEFRQGTQASVHTADGLFDAVVTFFVLDCLPAPTLPAALAHLAAVRRPGAPWLVADFAPPRAAWQRALLWVMYRFFRLTTGLAAHQLPQLRPALAALGLHEVGTGRRFYSGAVEALVFNNGRDEQVED